MESRVLEGIHSRESVNRIDFVDDCSTGMEAKGSCDGFDDVWSDRTESTVLRDEAGKSDATQYESLLSRFDDFVANDKLGMEVSNAVGYGFEVGDMVWGKVKSHPWWPGHIYNEAFASPSVRRTRREDHVLVAFFGDSSYGWFDPAELVHFVPHYVEKSQQTNSRSFVKAVEEAVDEATRRCSVGLACRCRNPYNFRPTTVQGYFAVDVADYEPGVVYSGVQIAKARQSFQPDEMLSFVKQLAMMPQSGEQRSIEWIKSKATVLAYRKAVFEEFDETYAQAFGMQPVRPSREPASLLDQSLKEPCRAPLSGPLVIAEALGGGKGAAKSAKFKDQSKQERYLFKRRDEANNLTAHLISQGHASSSTQPAYMEGSTLAAGDYVFQKRVPAVSAPQPAAKDEPAGDSSRDGAVVDLDKKALMADPQVCSSKVASPASSADQVSAPTSTLTTLSANVVAMQPVDKGKGVLQEMKEEMGPDAVSDFTGTGGSDSSVGLPFPSVICSSPYVFQPKGDLKHQSAFKVSESSQQSSQCFTTREEEFRGPNHVPDSCSGALPMRISDGGVKKAKVHKRPAGEFSSEKSIPGEKKKKRKKEFGVEMGSVHGQKHSVTGKGGLATGKLSGKSIQAGLTPRENNQVDHLKKETAGGSISNSVGMLPLIGMGDREPELPQLLADLQALALDPFHGLERNRPAIIRQLFMQFRSLVYQKSLVLPPPAETEPTEVRLPKHPTGVGVSDSLPGENIRDLQSSKPPKPPKPPTRPDDPTKAGRKRVSSDRREEIAAKKLKKMNDLKSLAAEKKATLKILEGQREGKETATLVSPKSSKLDAIKKMESPAKAEDPTMLVMKFPQGTSLPSVPELKARFARFGPLDHSGTRVFWKSSTCRIVFRHKVDAETAHKYAIGNNSLFGNVSVRYHIREVEVPAPEVPEPSKGREDASMELPQLRDSSNEQRPSAAFLAQPTQQPVTQLKSCLKKSSGDEVAASISGGIRGTPRVKFMLGGEESSRGEQLMVGNRNNFNNNASFADGGASSTSVAMDFNSKNFQKVIPPSQNPILPYAQFPKPPNNLHHHLEASAPRILHNFSTPTPPPSAPSIDISQQMLSLLTRCNDVVTNVKSFLGYVPYHSL